MCQDQVFRQEGPLPTRGWRTRPRRVRRGRRQVRLTKGSIRSMRWPAYPVSQFCSRVDFHAEGERTLSGRCVRRWRLQEGSPLRLAIYHRNLRVSLRLTPFLTWIQVSGLKSCILYIPSSFLTAQSKSSFSSGIWKSTVWRHTIKEPKAEAKKLAAKAVGFASITVANNDMMAVTA